MDQQTEIDLVRRALALRAKGRIGVLYSYQDSYYIASDEHDPFGTRTRVSLARLAVIVEEAEAHAARPAPGLARANSGELKNNSLVPKTVRG